MNNLQRLLVAGASALMLLSGCAQSGGQGSDPDEKVDGPGAMKKAGGRTNYRFDGFANPRGR